MTEGEMKKVSAWIPIEILTKLEEKGYQNRAEAIRLGLEYLLKESNMDDKRTPLESQIEGIRNPMDSIKNPNEEHWNPMESHKEDNKNLMESNGIQYEVLKIRNEELDRRIEMERTYLKREIERLTDIIDKAPDPVELAEVRAHFEGLRRLLEEKDKRIEDLTREVTTLNGFAHYFKTAEIKQIEAPAADKKSHGISFGNPLFLSRLKPSVISIFI
jgi:Arc/MetJ-type ribon-helix-helix transcriptional regulator